MRKRLDLYESDAAHVDTLLRYIRVRGPVFEPCSGPGVISTRLKNLRFAVITNDIDPAHVADFAFDARNLPLSGVRAASKQWYGQDVSEIISNPPFGIAHAILENFHAQGAQVIAFLLRLSFLEPGRENGTDAYNRGQWLARHPPTRVIAVPRYSFTRDGKTDSVGVAWMVWIRDRPGTIDIAAPTV